LGSTTTTKQRNCQISHRKNLVLAIAQKQKILFSDNQNWKEVINPKKISTTNLSLLFQIFIKQCKLNKVHFYIIYEANNKTYYLHNLISVMVWLNYEKGYKA